MKWIIGLTMLISPAVMADISLNFEHTATTFGILRVLAQRSRSDFSINGSGAVTLDASTTSLAANIITSVNLWDGGVGTVTDPLLFGTTFQILMTSSSVLTANRSFTMDGRYSTGMIGVSGNNSSRIDGQTATPTPDDMERLTFTLTSGSPLITLKSFNWDFASTAGLFSGCQASGWRYERYISGHDRRVYRCPLDIRNDGHLNSRSYARQRS